MQEVEDNTTKLVDVIVLADKLITIDKAQYKIVEDHDSGFDKEKIEERYNNVLDKYDYIVGDWGYDQLRFKGFYEDERKEATLDNRISHLEDYLIEYCNFGCAYFVLEKVRKAPLKNHHKTNSHKFRTRNNSVKPKAGPVKNNKNHNSSNKKNKFSKRRSANSKKTASVKKTFKIRKIGEQNK
ncbi:YutD family protein [Companilactobacillus nuruki]|uniref:Transcriptional regulator n=1 Tax=Companilactobacillus nuruki TaxID=1993540 RepID=A0A2N7ASG0_9LACO|nr:YutD family protein [Companilactobacillus nuruki]PMD68290.1 transcriptional regulator [Companilactobacillus nuruki]